MPKENEVPHKAIINTIAAHKKSAERKAANPYSAAASSSDFAIRPFGYGKHGSSRVAANPVRKLHQSPSALKRPVSTPVPKRLIKLDSDRTADKSTKQPPTTPTRQAQTFRRPVSLSPSPSPSPVRCNSTAKPEVSGALKHTLLDADDFINDEDDDDDLNAAIPADFKVFKDGLHDFEGDCDLAGAKAGLDLTDDSMEPEGLFVDLMPHQVIGVDWMLRQERKDVNRGGIQADDMGMGKTLQALATIVLNPSKDQDIRATLVIVTPALLEQWKNEIDDKSNLQYLVYHGSGREYNARQMRRFDVVITTYTILAREAPSASKAKPAKKRGTSYSNVKVAERDRGPLFQREWYRIILDEAHNIRNHNTAVFKAVVALEGDLRWCLAGRLVYNHLADIYAALRFIGVVDWPVFKKRVVDLVRRNPEEAAVRAQAFLRQVMLRRTHKSTVDGITGTGLPKKTQTLVELEFAAQERSLYDATELADQAILKQWYRQGTLLNQNSNAVFAKLMRLRQLCLHPELTGAILEADGSTGTPSSTQALMQAALGSLASLVETSTLCDVSKSEVPAVTKPNPNSIGDDSFPRKRFRTDEPKGGKAKRSKSAKSSASASGSTKPSGDAVASTKLKEMGRLLREWKQEDATSKTLIFCSLTKMLELAADYLENQGFRYAMYTGSMSNKKKIESLELFTRTDPDAPSVLLISTTAGGAGLNLTAANRIIALDLSWSPAVEAQAFARAHRIGQKREVKVVRLVIKSTVEQRILEKQEEKQAMADGAMGEGSGKRLQKMGAKDIMALFGITV